jgi:APA family basic amino acid/polyamine antiporter
MAAVARGFSKYLALLCNLDPTIFTLEINNTTYFFDFMAGGIVMLMSVLLSLGVRESSFFVSSECTGQQQHMCGSNTCAAAQLASAGAQPTSQSVIYKPPSFPLPAHDPAGVTIIKLVLLVFVSIVGYIRGAVDNMSPFFDLNYGTDGIFLGAASIFFAYTGFDAIGNAAEEVGASVHVRVWRGPVPI